MLLFLLVPAAEVFVFVEVGLAIGWLVALLLLLGTSLLGGWLLRIEGRTAVERVSRAVVEHRPPGAAAIDGALAFLGCALLVVPGFITDALGAVLVLPPTRALARRWISRRFEGRVMRFVSSVGGVGRGRRRMPPADIESSAVEDELDELGR
ncbi:MAG TPA: FxsA family protein [Solirubrobacteraceae bacterium]